MAYEGTLQGRLVLADLIPGAKVRDTLLVLGSAGFVGVAAQVAIPIPGTPVPFTMQTFAVLVAGAALGMHRAVLGMLLYLALGVAGAPWFAPEGGFGTVGYVVGFVLAAAVVGRLAAAGGDRTPIRTLGSMAAGTLVIYAVGVPWLMAVTGMDLMTAVAAGVLPFLIGDGIKIILAAGTLPAAWRLTRRL